MFDPKAELDCICQGSICLQLNFLDLFVGCCFATFGKNDVPPYQSDKIDFSCLSQIPYFFNTSDVLGFVGFLSIETLHEQFVVRNHCNMQLSMVVAVVLMLFRRAGFLVSLFVDNISMEYHLCM